MHNVVAVVVVVVVVEIHFNSIQKDEQMFTICDIFSQIRVLSSNYHI